MDGIAITIDDVPELGTRVGACGAIGCAMAGDELFEYVVAIAVLLYEMSPR